MMERRTSQRPEGTGRQGDTENKHAPSLLREPKSEQVERSNVIRLPDRSERAELRIVAAHAAQSLVDILPAELAGAVESLDWGRARYAVVGFGGGRLVLRACDRHSLPRGLLTAIASLKSVGCCDFQIDFLAGNDALRADVLRCCGLMPTRGTA